MNDAVMGSWTYQYDDFNRLTGGAAASGFAAGLNLGWSYDRYGNRGPRRQVFVAGVDNRWAQNATGSGGAGAVQPQLSFTGNNNRVDGWNYDQNTGNPGSPASGFCSMGWKPGSPASGFCSMGWKPGSPASDFCSMGWKLLNDGRNSYTYDAENRIVTFNGQPTYVYDAEGRRVAKLGSGGTVTASYFLGLGGEQVSELSISGAWVHSNVFVGGRLLATYVGPAEPAAAGYHFHLTDWLGTKRMQVSPGGGQDETCTSYPFGDGLNCTGPDATEHHFTGKERDTESRLDYFGARYLDSNLGRFMTPDWYPDPTEIPYANLGDPQSLNLYSYVHNDPNNGIDSDGHCSSGVATSNCMDPTEYGGMAGFMMGEEYSAAAHDAWSNLPSAEQDALGTQGLGFLDWEALRSPDWGYVRANMDTGFAIMGWYPIDVVMRGLLAWHGTLGLAGHSALLDERGGHQWEVLGVRNKGGGRKANQQVRDTYGTDRQSKGEKHREWLSPEHYSTFTARATAFKNQKPSCPSCGADYKLTSYNSNTFVFNMLSQNGVRPPSSSNYIMFGYSQQHGAW